MDEVSNEAGHRRSTCAHCLRAQSACWCGCVHPISTTTQLLILQHPLEVRHAKNTGRLLAQCVRPSRLEVGEVFDVGGLQALLHAPWGGDAAQPLRTVLLYPDTPADPQLPLQAPPAWPEDGLSTNAAWRLVVLDATWRKSRKMLYLNPALQALPRLPLHATAPGGYVIRKAQAPGQLSSFEAGMRALQQLERWADDAPQLQQLQSSFDDAMALHQRLQALHQSQH